MNNHKITSLSGNEIFCMRLKGFSPSGIAIGNSVQSMGFLRGVRSAFRGVVGGEVADATELILEGREAAFKRMFDEAVKEGAHGVVGVTSDLRSLSGNTEYLFVGSCVKGSEDSRHFTSAGDAQELYCHMDAGYQPLQHVFGNIAYAVGVVQGVSGFFKTMVRGEIREFSDIFNSTRHYALERMIDKARKAKANSVVGVRTMVLDFNGLHEMCMTGTAANNPALPVSFSNDPVTSDLTGEELWAMASLGYAPIKLLMSTSVYSLGIVGGFTSLFKSFTKGEIPEMTSLIYEARENVFDRLNHEAAEIGADEVVGIKTYIVEIGSGLLEVVAIGTAVRKLPNINVETPELPVQAIIRDKDTWVSGSNGFDLQSIRAGS
jgi:uncharacterized protein YbjQ (UPF0145 family)